ncbi:hypothetical protein, partial [Caloramator fervidus]|uniref:hypothetical protein n=1 Tax=Caloramator fervidus TaxID=29344 RepID=UPI001A9A4709
VFIKYLSKMLVKILKPHFSFFEKWGLSTVCRHLKVPFLLTNFSNAVITKLGGCYDINSMCTLC